MRYNEFSQCLRYFIVIVFLLVFANGFFVASEFALVGVHVSRVQTLAESGNTKAQRLLHLLDNLNAYISATHFGITMAGDERIEKQNTDV